MPLKKSPIVLKEKAIKLKIVPASKERQRVFNALEYVRTHCYYQIPLVHRKVITELVLLAQIAAGKQDSNNV